MKSVTILREEADKALETVGPLPYHYLVKRFKEEHGLDFTPSQLSEGKCFKWEEETNGKAFRVTYLGGLDARL